MSNKNMEKQIRGLVQSSFPSVDENEKFSKKKYLEVGFVSFCVKLALTESLVEDGYPFVAKLYKYLNLFNNQEIIKHGCEKVGEIIGTNNQIVTVSLTKSVYYSVISIAADSYAKTHDEGLYTLISEYLQGLENYERNMTSKAVIFLHQIYSLSDDEALAYANDNSSIVSTLQGYYSHYKTSSFRGNQNLNYTIFSLAFGGGNLDSNKKYLSLTSDLKKRICKVCHCKDFNIFIERVKNSFPFSGVLDSDMKIDQMVELSDMFEQTSRAYNLKVGILHEAVDALTSSDMNRVFKDTVLSDLSQQIYEGKISPDNITLKIEDTEMFIYKLCFGILVELMIHSTVYLLNAYYDNFSFERIDRLAAIQEVSNQLYIVKKEYDDLAIKYKSLKEKHTSLDRRYRAKKKEEDRVYGEAIRKLEKTNNLLEDENHKLKERVSQLEEYISLQDVEDEADTNEIDEIALATHRLLVVGGRVDVVNEIKGKLPSAVFTDNETDSININNIDCIVMFTKFMSHKLFYKYITVARERGIKVVYVASTNTDMILRHISKEIAV